ncbi:MAG: DUF3880 domain-containing protein [Lachnospiraceae bacterium]|nr:DUF3880 domain-containing protein [Lachnospiraceae bacterium]
MKILLMDWPAFGGNTVKRVLIELGHEVEVFEFPQNSGETDRGEELTIRITEALLKSEAEVVFSFNYFPVIAIAVHACHRKYISWVYDSPAVYLYDMTVFFPENYIFHFDSYETERMRRDGVKNVFYLPLAADVDRYSRMVPDADHRKKYNTDIALIGSLYREKYGYFGKYTNFDEYLKGYLDGIVNAQEKVYGVNFLEEVLDRDIQERIMKTVPLMEGKGDRYDSAAWDFANYYLAMRVTANEREHMLKKLSECYKVSLYTGGATKELPQIRNMGTVDYYTEAPYAIKCAKINLNITLKSIRSGIPQRAMDIMGCGGFLLSNYQPDLCDEFVAGKDFVYYESIEHAVELTGYYLEHDEERKRIAENGYEKVRKSHNFRVKCEQILEISEET